MPDQNPVGVVVVWSNRANEQIVVGLGNGKYFDPSFQEVFLGIFDNQPTVVRDGEPNTGPRLQIRSDGNIRLHGSEAMLEISPIVWVPGEEGEAPRTIMIGKVEAMRYQLFHRGAVLIGFPFGRGQTADLMVSYEADRYLLRRRPQEQDV